MREDGAYVSTPLFKSTILALRYICGKSRIPLCSLSAHPVSLVTPSLKTSRKLSAYDPSA